MSSRGDARAMLGHKKYTAAGVRSSGGLCLPPEGHAVDDLLRLRGVCRVIEVDRQLQVPVFTDHVRVERLDRPVLILVAQPVAEPCDAAPDSFARVEAGG